jgi:hypothetical protein
MNLLDNPMDHEFRPAERGNFRLKNDGTRVFRLDKFDFDTGKLIDNLQMKIHGSDS